MSITEQRINRMINLIKDSISVLTFPVDEVYYKECDYKIGTYMPSDDGFVPFGANDKWGKTPDSHGWFLLKGKMPKKYQFCRIRLNIDTSRDGWNVYNPQFIAYIDGKAVQGLDTNHRYIELDYCDEYTVYLYAYTGSMGADLNFRRYFSVIDEKAEKLYYDLTALYGVALLQKETNKEYADLINAIIKAINIIDFRDTASPEYRSSVELACEFIDDFYTDYCGEQLRKVVCMGHTHIDIAWLWTLNQTKEKAQHTFSTVLKLMDKYPNLIFMTSQPQLLKYVKQEDPELYERIKQKVSQGRFELEGAMWVEADCNLTSGESLIRQIIHGKRFFKDEFNVDSEILWLPDVFGYSASLPQICRKCGVDAFVTSKISWNDTNRMPHDVFMWTGIDGTKLFTYFLSAQQKKRGTESPNYVTYVATSDPDYVTGCFDRFTDKALTDEVLLTMGWGDGGGGPTADMCEKSLRLERGIPSCPQAVNDGAVSFINRLKSSISKKGVIPEWEGELYLEYHRGTYTSASKNKLLNRNTEFMLRNTELWSVASELIKKTPYPEEQIYDAWEVLLLNQFHDIIPGSCIPEVYKVSREQYSLVRKTLDQIISNSLTNISSDITGSIVFNTTMQANATFKINESTYGYFTEMAQAGYSSAVYDCANSFIFSENTIETPFYTVRFDSDGYICSLFDKNAKREIANGSFGRFTAYEDLPFQYDCWNIEEYHEEKCYDVKGLISFERISCGSGAGFISKRKFMNSEITQKIIFFEHSRRIDFETNVDWRERNILLKTEFESDINNTDGVFDIQYGFVKRPANRNTSWEKAKFEVCGQKYADISDGGYGLALLNDCKYGHSVRRGKLTLSLLKSSRYPNEYIDCDNHTFTYSALPHEGDFRMNGVLDEAEILNNPPIIFGDSTIAADISPFSIVKCDSRNIFLGAVKKSYDGKGRVLRFAESFNKRTNAEFEFGFNVSKAYICDMTENEETEIQVNNNKISLEFKPFEIVTIKAI